VIIFALMQQEAESGLEILSDFFLCVGTKAAAAACQRVMTEEVTSDGFGPPRRFGSLRARGGGHISTLMEEEKMAMSLLSTYYVFNLDSCCRSRRPIILCH